MYLESVVFQLDGINYITRGGVVYLTQIWTKTKGEARAILTHHATLRDCVRRKRTQKTAGRPGGDEAGTDGDLEFLSGEEIVSDFFATKYWERK